LLSNNNKKLKMKKLTVLAGVLCFVFVSCCNKTADAPEEKQCTKEEKHEHGSCKMTEEQKAECEAFRKQWNDWENLTDDVKKDLVGKMKVRIDEKHAAMEAKMKACKAKWATFDNLSIDEQKALIDKQMACGKEKCCKKDDEKQCEKKCEKK
jgi:hypothetical protein